MASSGCGALRAPRIISPDQASPAPSSLPPGSLGLWPEAGLAFPRVPGPQPSESFSALEAGHPIPPEQHTQMEPPPPPTVPGFEGRREGTGGAGNRQCITSVPTIPHPSLPVCWRVGGGEGREPSFAEHLLCSRCSSSFLKAEGKGCLKQLEDDGAGPRPYGLDSLYSVLC